MYVGQWVWHRPHSVHEYKSKPCFQVRSRIVLVPNSSFSRLGVPNFPLGLSRWKYTLGRPVITWKCLPYGRKLRNTRMIVRWSQKAMVPRAIEANVGIPRRPTAITEVTGSHQVNPRCCSTQCEAPKVNSVTINPMISPRIKYPSQEGVIRSGFTRQRRYQKYAAPRMAPAASRSLAHE